MNKFTAILKKTAGFTAVAAAWAVIWILLSKKTGLEFVFPGPKAVFETLIKLIPERRFALAVGRSMLNVLTGWACGLVSGIILSVLCYKSSAARMFFAPALHVIKSTPVASFIILAFLLMKPKTVPSFTGSLIVIPVVWAGMTEGLASKNKELTELADFYKMSRGKRFRYITVPTLLPFFSAAATSSMGLCWKAVIAAEVIANPKGSVGSEIYSAKIYLEGKELFAWTAVVILLSVLFEGVIKIILRGLRRYD